MECICTKITLVPVLNVNYCNILLPYVHSSLYVLDFCMYVHECMSYSV